jgi:hypothetical protein
MMCKKYVKLVYIGDFYDSIVSYMALECQRFAMRSMKMPSFEVKG